MLSKARRTSLSPRAWLPVVVLVCVVGSLATPAGAEEGPSNNFGSDNTVADGLNVVYLNDGPIAEWSTWWGFDGWSEADRIRFGQVMFQAIEYYEPFDVTVTRGADNTKQDARVVPVGAPSPTPGVLGLTQCIVDAAAIFGEHHHRVCDYKQITLYEDAFSSLEFAYNVVRHEFGHQLGMRHSDAPCPGVELFCRGVSANGTPQQNTHTVPGTDSLMYSASDADNPRVEINIQDAGNLLVHY